MTNKLFGAHEFQDRAPVVVKTSSDRSFGLIFGGFFALLGGLSLSAGGTRWVLWFGLSIAFVIIAWTAPGLLTPLNRLWTKFGLLLHTIVSPVIVALLFYGCIMPTGLLMRLFGKDPLRRLFEPEAASYWLVRNPPGPTPESFKNQF